IEPLVRRDMPNILLSHNPNSFNRAAELGIEVSLAGHTHGGQIQVEILDHRLSPARFISDYVAGMYPRRLFMPSIAHLVSASAHLSQRTGSEKFLRSTSIVASALSARPFVSAFLRKFPCSFFDAFSHNLIFCHLD